MVWFKFLDLIGCRVVYQAEQSRVRAQASWCCRERIQGANSQSHWWSVRQGLACSILYDRGQTFLPALKGLYALPLTDLSFSKERGLSFVLIYNAL